MGVTGMTHRGAKGVFETGAYKTGLGEVSLWNRRKKK